MLENIHSPSDVKAIPQKELPALAQEIRQYLIETVSKNGGHLASNLGMVEATIALHRVFSSPEDKLIFDVGHQCYTHKLLTGRYAEFSTLRQMGGISGFQNCQESEHDPFTEGHCGTSISSALGVAVANKLQGKDSYTVAVVGDGALTNGMIYEALNNCAERNISLIVLINDNNMSISGNIGGLHNYLSRIRTSQKYFRLKHGLEKTLSKIPLLGRPLKAVFRWFKNVFKRLFIRNNLFEDLGVEYLGPVDGHDFKKLSVVLEEAKREKRCCIVHMTTKKGKGYSFAEDEAERYHSVGAFEPTEGASVPTKDCFSEQAGKIVCAEGEQNGKICAITAAMCDGVGLNEFKEKFPTRFFDVGIAEEHAVTFAAGLSKEGMKPVLFLYSTFAQRCFDQFLHDISIQKLPLTLMLDRSGIVSGDGVTHQGIFDCSLLSGIPDTTIYSPATYAEMRACLKKSLDESGLSVVRYPKGKEVVFGETLMENGALSYTQGIENAKAVVITYGRMAEVALQAKKLLGEDVGVIKLLQVYPLPMAEIRNLLQKTTVIYFLEEGAKVGGIGEKFFARLSAEGWNGVTHLHAIEGFVEHGSLQDLYEKLGFTAEVISNKLKQLCNSSANEL